MMGDAPTGLDDLDYESAEPVEIEVKFVSDWWKDTEA